MRELPIRNLRAELATAVRRAESGEIALVTVAGRPVAQLGPIGTTPTGGTGVADLVARGVLLAPRRTDRYRPGPAIPVWRATRLDRALDDVR